MVRWIGEAAEVPIDGKPNIDAIGLDSRELDSQLTHHPQIATLTKQVEIAGNGSLAAGTVSKQRSPHGWRWEVQHYVAQTF